MRRLIRVLLLLVLAAAVLGAAAFGIARAVTRGPVMVPAAEGSAERGAYVFAAGGCGECHTATEPGAPALAGGRRLDTPFGTFYSPNITPDPVHGIGAWSDEDFLRAMRQGVAPDGSDYYPAFPYPSFTGMTDQDMLDLKAYLFAQPPAAVANRPHELAFPFSLRPLVTAWKLLYLDQGPLAPDPGVAEFAPDPGAAEVLNRGAYLVRAQTHCGECHTPRDALGGPDDAMFLAGSADGAEGQATPNITPDDETGIGGWSESDLAFLLQSGMTPGGDFVGGTMAAVVQHSTSKLTPEDRAAIAAYVLSRPPVRHEVPGAKSGRGGDGGGDDEDYGGGDDDEDFEDY